MHGIAITLNTVLCSYIVIIRATLMIVPSDCNTVHCQCFADHDTTNIAFAKSEILMRKQFARYIT
jgi:hypothetical protein